MDLLQIWVTVIFFLLNSIFNSFLGENRELRAGSTVAVQEVQ